MISYECTRIEKHARQWVARYGHGAIVVDARYDGEDERWRAVVKLSRSAEDAEPVQVPLEQTFANAYQAARVGIETAVAFASASRSGRQATTQATSGRSRVANSCP